LGSFPAGGTLGPSFSSFEILLVWLVTPDPSIVRRFEGEHVLLTGVTGLLAKSVLERVLRAVPDVERIHLLVRPRRGVEPVERVWSSVFSSPLFDALRALHGEGFEDFVRSKVAVVTGDLGAERLGLTEDAYAELAERLGLIVNSAAACSFLEPLDRAIQTNTLGAGRILQLAKDAGDVPFVHVSTCYVGAPMKGLVHEEIIPAGHSIPSFEAGGPAAFDLDVEIRESLERCARVRRGAPPGAPDIGDRAAAELGMERARELGWHDVYQLSKALGEQLLARDRGRVPLAIVRPSIIESTYEEPVPGWIDGIRMADPIIMEYAKGTLVRFVGSVDTVLDLIPCDMATHAVMAAVPPAGDPDFVRVYQVASGESNPVRLGELTVWAHETLTELARERPGDLSPPGTMGRWVPEWRFRAELRMRRWLLEASRLGLTALGRRRRAQRAALLQRMVKKAEGLADLYACYTTTSPRFVTANTRALLEGLSAEDRERFSFDVTRIDWRDYLQARHIPGLLRLKRPRAGPAAEDDYDERRSIPA